MEQSLEVYPKKFYEEAKHMLANKDLLGFLSKISIAIEMFRNDRHLFAKSTFLKATGLFTFHQYSKAVESIEEALNYNTGIEAFELKKRLGVAKGFLGYVEDALQIFKELEMETDDVKLLIGIYINITWIHLTLKKHDPAKHNIEEARHYLDLANEYFDSLTDSRKWKVCNNYSVYYFYKGYYNKAIFMLKESLKYCLEDELPEIYNNLAELYFKVDNGSDSYNLTKEYIHKAEILGRKSKNYLSLGKVFYTKAMVGLRENQLFTALDNLYLSFEYFTKIEAQSYALDCLKKINETMKNLGKFLTDISQVTLLPKDYRETIFKTKNLIRKELFNFIRQKKLLESFSQRLGHENDVEIMDLKMFEGIVYGFLNKLDKAVNTFKTVIAHTEDSSIKSLSYLNLAWLYMAVDKKTPDDNKLKKTKICLDLANEYFCFVSNDVKYKVLFNYSIYFCLKKNFKRAIKVLKDSLKYCNEKDLSDLYNNLAELNLKLEDDLFSEVIRGYLRKAEILGSKYNNFSSLGQTFYLLAEVELGEDQFFSALDNLYLAFEYFKKAEETVLASECLLKINELTDTYEKSNLKSLKSSLSNKVLQSSIKN